MKTKFAFCTLAISLSAALPAFAAHTDAPGVPVSVLITLEAKGKSTPTISKDDLRVTEGRETRTVTDFRRLDSGRTQLLFLIDDSAGGSFDTQISELKNFVSNLPPDVEVGIGYMRNGMSQMASEFTTDHARAAQSIRLAEGPGGADVSPYDSLTDAVKKWPTENGVTRREVIMISSGIEGLGGGLPPDNQYVNAGINSALKSGVVVYAIYNPSFGHWGHSLWRSFNGQNLLSQLTDETGGELYQVGTGSAVSFQPFLQDIMARQSQQYMITFTAKAEKKSGLQDVKISSTTRTVSVAAPDKVFVKASL